MVVVVVVAWHRGCWLVAVHVWLAIDIACLCAMPGPLGPVDSGMGGQLVLSDHLRRSSVVWLWPLVGHSARVVGNQRRALVCNARAFGPGGWWCGGMPLVLSDRRCSRRGARLWPLAGRCLVVPRDRHRPLLHNVRGSPGHRGSVGGAHAP